MKQHFFHFSSYETCCCTNVYVKNNLSDMNLILMVQSITICEIKYHDLTFWVQQNLFFSEGHWVLCLV